MSSNITNRDVSVRLGTVIDEADISVFQGLTTDTLNVIGTSHKGKAFVPQNIVNEGTITRIKNDETTEELEIYNTINNILGTERSHRHRHLNDSYVNYIDSQSYDALSIWLQGNKTQSTFTRVLGIGNGKKTQRGIYENAGFNLEKNISRGSEDNLTKTRNPQAIEGGVNGNITFVLSNKKNQPNLQFLEDLGATEDDLFINSVILSADGVLPSLLSDANNYVIDEQNSSYDRQVKSLAGQLTVNIELKGLNSEEANRTLIDESLISSLNIKRTDSYSPQSIVSFPNYWSDKFLERGHLIYSHYSSSFLLQEKRDNIILITSRNYSDLNNNDLPDYNSFEMNYQTAKTPWVTSQPVNRDNLSDNRENMQNSVVNLFRLHALDDGEIGNRFRIKINPLTRGDHLTNRYATFEMYIFEYEPRNNTYIELDKIDIVDLNPDSEFYIARLIGDENTYYDIKSKKVVTDVKYERRNKYFRVEVHEDVENKIISPTLIPSGFRAYPHIRINKDAFPDYAEVLADKNIYQMPVLYSPNFFNDNITGNFHHITNNWGVIFRPAELANGILSSLVTSSDNPHPDFFSPHWFHTKYFLNGLTNSDHDIWVEDDSYLNSFFSLEKIYYNIDDLANIDAESNLMYTRKGSAPGADETKNYINLDDPQLWDNDDTLIDVLENRMSFDFFTYGGFDGVDIRDRDKKFLNNNALVRESNNEDSSISFLENPTLFAYDQAIDIATSGILSSDLLLLPGISNLYLTRKCIDICEESKTMQHISEVNTMSHKIVGDPIAIRDIASNYFVDEETFLPSPVPFFIAARFALEFANNFEEIKQNVYSLGLNSKYYLPMFGSIIGVKNSSLKYLDSSLFALKKSSRNIQDNISFLNVSEDLNDYTIISLINRLNYRQTSWDLDTKEFRKNKLNVIYTNSEGIVDLYSQNTAYETRGSIYSLYNNIRIINYVKKEIKFNLLTESFVNSVDPILFSQNSTINSLYTRLELQLNNLLKDLQQRNILDNFSVKINSQIDEKTVLDAQNYILRGTVFLSLNSDNNFDIIILRIEDILKEVSLLSTENNIDLIQKYI